MIIKLVRFQVVLEVIEQVEADTDEAAIAAIENFSLEEILGMENIAGMEIVGAGDRGFDYIDSDLPDVVGGIEWIDKQ